MPHCLSKDENNCLAQWAQTQLMQKKMKTLHWFLNILNTDFYFEFDFENAGAAHYLCELKVFNCSEALHLFIKR